MRFIFWCDPTLGSYQHMPDISLYFSKFRPGGARKGEVIHNCTALSCSGTLRFSLRAAYKPSADIFWKFWFQVSSWDHPVGQIFRGFPKFQTPRRRSGTTPKYWRRKLEFPEIALRFRLDLLTPVTCAWKIGWKWCSYGFIVCIIEADSLIGSRENFSTLRFPRWPYASDTSSYAPKLA